MALHPLALDVPVEQAGAVQEVGERRRSTCPRPARARVSGTGSRPTAPRPGRSAPCAVGRRPGSRPAAPGRSSLRRACSRARRSTIARRNSRTRAARSERLTEISSSGASRSHARETNSEPPKRPGGEHALRGARSAGSPPASGRPNGVPTTRTCQPGWTPTHVSTSSSAYRLSLGRSCAGLIRRTYCQVRWAGVPKI